MLTLIRFLTSIVIMMMAFLQTQSVTAQATIPVQIHNFARAETDMYLDRFIKMSALGKIAHNRELTPIDEQSVIRMNRDTLYSTVVFDLDGGPVTITLPDSGKRYMAMQLINQDHYTHQVVYAPTKTTFDKAAVGTRYCVALFRTMVDPQEPGDLAKVHQLQDQIKIEQAQSGTWSMPNWNDQDRTKIRNTLLELSKFADTTRGNAFGSKAEVDPVLFLLVTASGWGGNPKSAAMYVNGQVPNNDGKTAYMLKLHDVPVDGFWSITVYNEKGFLEKNLQNAYSVNNLTAKPNADGSITIQFGGDPNTAKNYLPIPAGWNYIARLYRPRPEVISGQWIFPEPAVLK